MDFQQETLLNKF